MKDLFFGKAQYQRQYLNPLDPEPVSVILGKSPVVFCGPHNGIAVPGDVKSALGVEPKWFYAAHEASDLHMASLFDVLQEQFKDASFIWGNYSRLICDTNRLPEHAIVETSSEYTEIPIPRNSKDALTDHERQYRMDEVYWPYHDTFSTLIDNVRSQNSGAAIMIDLHSFSPVWKGNPRHTEITTLRYERNSLSKLSEDFFRQHDQYRFVSGSPYRIRESKTNAAKMISKKDSIPYFGIEIRNDLIANKERRLAFTNYIKSYIDHLTNHPLYAQLLDESTTEKHKAANLELEK